MTDQNNTKRNPNVILLMAATADGVIARDSMELVDWTGQVDKRYFVEITRKAGAMIMGSRTFDTIGKVLPGRKNIVVTRDKTRVSKDENLVFTDEAPETILKGLQKEGYDSVALIGGSVINSLFMKAGLIDEVHLTLVPRIFGKGLGLFNTELDVMLSLIGIEDMGEGHVLLKYRVVKE